MTEARLRTGRAGEEIACRHLTAAGMSIHERNARTRAGELDAVALDGRTLVFVEVKTMRAGARHGPERPELAVGRQKQMRIRRLARAWLADNSAPPHSTLRFDVIGVLLDRDGTAAVTHIRDAF